jgi:patatin-related protein
MTTSQQPSLNPALLWSRIDKRVPQEQLRFAVVLNGGVSLAVWMGGGIHELNSLTRPPAGSPYEHMLRLARSEARADVIAGTSAGGINGAALALGQINENADLRIMRRLWEEQGRLEALLRQPFQGNPTSMLKGDDYFLPELNRAMRALTAKSTEPDRPMDLTITTTILNPAAKVTTDALGQSVWQEVHEAHFRFRGTTRWERYARRFVDDTRSGRQVAPPGDFDDRSIKPDEQENPFSMAGLASTASAMAFAARCSAGFPFAFEPSFVPIRLNGQAAEAPDPLRPDMARFASWVVDGLGDDQSRFAVDGGVLANTPTRAALAAIAGMSTEGPIRRIMLLIHPHAATGPVQQPDQDAEPPSLISEVSGLLGALASQGSRSFVEQIEGHNLSSSSGRGGRWDILGSIGTVDDIYALNASPALWEQYRAVSIRRAARDLAPAAHRSEGWSDQRKRQAIRRAHQEWLVGGSSNRNRADLPYLPSGPPPNWDVLMNPLGGPESNQTDELCPLQGWAWGYATATGIADGIADIIRRCQGVADRDHAAALTSAQTTMSRIRAALHTARELTDRMWEDPHWATTPPNTEYWLLRLIAYSLAMRGSTTPSADREQLLLAAANAPFADLSDSAKRFARLLHLPEDSARWADGVPQRWAGDAVAYLVWQSIMALASARDAIAGTIGELPGFDGLSKLIAPEEAAAESRGFDAAAHALESAVDPTDSRPDRIRSRSRLFRSNRSELILFARIMALEVSAWTISDDRAISGVDSEIDLIQLSAQVENWFTEGMVSADDKLAGAALSRFGGFLKRSWRMNDWIWGRLDAATLLSRAVLAPDRMRRVAEVAGLTRGTQAEARIPARVMVEAMVEKLYGDELKRHGDDPQVQRVTALAEEAVTEMTELFTTGQQELSDQPIALDKLSSLAAHAIHLDIIAEELPILAAAIRADGAEGSNSRSLGQVFLARREDEIRAVQDHKPRESGWVGRNGRALDAFAHSGVGREPLRDEGTSDQMIRTAATAVGVAVTMLDSDRSGLGVGKAATKAVRGATLIPYWVLVGLSKGSPTAKYLSLTALSAGAILLVLSIFSVLPSWAASGGAALGVGCLFAALGFAALRSGTVLHGVAMLGLIVPTVVLAIGFRDRSAQAPGDAAVRGITAVVVTALVVAALILLGSIPNPLRTPNAAIDAGLTRYTRHTLTREIGPYATQRLFSAEQGGTYGFPVKYRLITLSRIVMRTAAWILGLVCAGLLVHWWVVGPAHIDLPDRTWLLLLVLTGILTAVGAVCARQSGMSLRIWQSIEEQTGSRSGLRPRWGGRRRFLAVGDAVLSDGRQLSHPAAIAANWAVVYGFIYGLLAAGAAAWLFDPNRPETVLLVLNGLLFSVALCVVIPVVGPRRFKRRIMADLAKDQFLMSRVERGIGEPALRGELVRRGVGYDFLVEPAGRDGSARLNGYGKDLYLQLKGQSHEGRGRGRPTGGIPWSIHLTAIFATGICIAVAAPNFLTLLPLSTSFAFVTLAALLIWAATAEGLSLVVIAKGLWRGGFSALFVGLGTYLITMVATAPDAPMCCLPTSFTAADITIDEADLWPWLVLAATGLTTLTIVFLVSRIAPRLTRIFKDEPSETP